MELRAEIYGIAIIMVVNCIKDTKYCIICAIPLKIIIFINNYFVCNCICLVDSQTHKHDLCTYVA